MDYGRSIKPFLMIFLTFGLGQTNWVDKFWGIWGTFSQTISTVLALYVLCPWENEFGCFSYKKLWFSGLTHIYPKYDISLKNLESSHHTSVVGEPSPGQAKTM